MGSQHPYKYWTDEPSNRQALSTEVTSSEAFVNDGPKRTDDNLAPKQERQSQRKAAQRAKYKMTEWIQTICAPLKDVENSSNGH